MLEAVRQKLDTGRWMQDAGHWTLDAGCWTLEAGRWTLDAGCWTLDRRVRKPEAGLTGLERRLEQRETYEVAPMSGGPACPPKDETKECLESRLRRKSRDCP
jgi:hypothetical protein